MRSSSSRRTAAALRPRDAVEPEHGHARADPGRRQRPGVHGALAVVSADGHVGTGVFTFGVGVDPPPPTEAVGSSGMTWRDDVARSALFASLALMIGVVGIRSLVLPRVVEPRVERRVYLLGTLGRSSR